MEPLSNARCYINGVVLNSKTLLKHGDRILWGNHHFFRVNCPKSGIYYLQYLFLFFFITVLVLCIFNTYFFKPSFSHYWNPSDNFFILLF